MIWACIILLKDYRLIGGISVAAGDGDVFGSVVKETGTPYSAQSGESKYEDEKSHDG